MVWRTYTRQDVFDYLMNGDPKIFPKDANYSDYVAKWLKIKIFHNQALSEIDIEAIEKFSNSFKIDVRALWKATSGHVEVGRNSKCANFLQTIIPFHHVCNCSNCTNKDIDMTADEKEKRAKYQKIAQQSLQLQKLIDDGDMSPEAVQHRAAQIAYQRGGTTARAAMNKIIDSPDDLTLLIDYLASLGISPKEKFSHELLLQIAATLNLTINEACKLAQILREKYGRLCVEAEFKKAMQEASVECEEFFEVVTESFEIHYHEKDPVTKKKISWTVIEPRDVVYCKDIEGKIFQVSNLCTYLVSIYYVSSIYLVPL